MEFLKKEVFIFLIIIIIFIMVQNYYSWGGTTSSNVYMFKTLCNTTNNAIKGQTDHYLFILALAVLLLPFKLISISVGKHFKIPHFSKFTSKFHLDLRKDNCYEQIFLHINSRIQTLIL